MRSRVRCSTPPRTSETGLGPLGASVHRTVLSQGAWVDARPGWVTGADALFERLLSAVPWRAEQRAMYQRVVDVPRLLCFYGEATALPDPLLAQARDALSEHYHAELGELVARTAGTVPVPGRAGQRRVARRHDRAGQHRGHSGGHRVARHTAAAAAPAARRQRACAPPRRRPRRPARHGRELPADLGARGAEDRPAHRAADQRAVPPARCPLNRPVSAERPPAWRRHSTVSAAPSTHSAPPSQTRLPGRSLAMRMPSRMDSSRIVATGDAGARW